MNLGDKLKFLRNLKGFTQEEVAEKLSISRRAYNDLENNKTLLDVGRLSNIAEVYGIKVEELLSFNESQAFHNCFNNNINGFFSAEKVESTGVTKEERDSYIQNMNNLINSFSEERKLYLDALQILTEKLKSS